MMLTYIEVKSKGLKKYGKNCSGRKVEPMAFTKTTLTIDTSVKIDLKQLKQLKQLKKFKPPKLTDEQIKRFKRRLIAQAWKKLNEPRTRERFEGEIG